MSHGSLSCPWPRGGLALLGALVQLIQPGTQSPNRPTDLLKLGIEDLEFLTPLRCGLCGVLRVRRRDALGTPGALPGPDESLIPQYADGVADRHPRHPVALRDLPRRRQHVTDGVPPDRDVPA